MTVRMLVNATAPGELRIAIVEDGELVELDIEAAEKSTVRGNIYLGKVRNVEASLEAAFVDFGQHKQGFLPFSEISSDEYYRKWDKKERPRITDVVRRDQDILVQVGKDAVGDKGATLTTYLSIPGRYVVLMPGSDAGGISRKIEDEKVRKRIRTMAQKLNKPDGCGFIVRTAGLNQTRLGIQRDLDKVSEQLDKIRDASKIARAPSILHAEPDLIARTLRDYFNEDIDEVWIDTKDEFDTAYEYFRDVMPELAERLNYYQNPIPIFAYYHVEEQIEATFERKVPMEGGGSIVIDQTEALVAIDVNSGKMTSEGDHENTVFKTNLKAADEVARQLRLRDLGGIVVVDFIDMELTKNKRAVEKALSDASKDDKARWKISRINSKGLCVLTRQRIRQGMRKAFQQRCPVCDGTGWVRSPESHSLSLLRRVEARLAQGGVGEVRVRTHRQTAEYISNYKRKELLALEREFNCRIVISVRLEMDRDKDEVQFLSKGELLAEITDKLPPRERRDRSRSKRKKRKKRGRDEDAAVVAEDDEESPRRRKKSRRGKKRDEEAAAKSEEAEAPPALEAKGNTTFTGRPSKAQLEKAKLERKIRQAKSKAKAAGEDPAEAAKDLEAELEALVEKLAAEEAEKAEAAKKAAEEAAAKAEEEGESEDREEGRSGRRRGRGRGRGRGRDKEAKVEAADADEADASPAEASEDAPDEVAAAEAAEGDVLEAEAKPEAKPARKPRSRGRRAPPANLEAPESLPETVGAAKEAAPAAPPPDPEGARTRKSLLDRIFGSR